MIQLKKVLAIIPARAGSKRIPFKNIRDLAGIPLIGWSLKDLKKSKYIDLAYVSTDSEDIQAVAKKYNVDSEPLRPSNLATDTSATIDVVLDILESKKTGFDIIVLLQPTSPFREIADIDKALEFFIQQEANSVISMCETESHPTWSIPLGEKLSMEDFAKKLENKRSQDLEKYYRLNGAIYIASTASIKANNGFFAKDKMFAYIMNKFDSIDIDTEEDFEIATYLAKKKIV